jgi:hypothetical protein
MHVNLLYHPNPSKVIAVPVINFGNAFPCADSAAKENHDAFSNLWEG